MKSLSVTFEYAKAAGLLRKAFVGQKAVKLFEQTSLSDLWVLLFNSQPPMMPERLLAEEIENQSQKKFLNQFLSFIKTSGSKNNVLTEIFDIYEVENLKEIISALESKEKECPKLIDVGNYGTIHPENWPDLGAITEGSKYSWVTNLPEIHSQKELDYKLDLQVLQDYWKTIHKLSGENREAHEQMFIQEYSVKNIIWALRLSVYYEMPVEDIKQHLLYVTENANEEDPVAGPALKALSIGKQDFNGWMKWKYSELVNPRVDGDSWTIDPVWMEQKAMIVQQKKYRHIFHQYPMTTAALIAWYKIKAYEQSCIRTAVESIRLNIASQEAMDAVGVSSN